MKIFEFLLQKFQPNKPLPRVKFDFIRDQFFFEDWLTGIRTKSVLFPTYQKKHIVELKQKLVGEVKHCLKAANDVILHKFNMLGSGEYISFDKERHTDSKYLPIDWHYDPVSKLHFPRNIFYKKWDLWKMRPGNADIKYPWELSRCQHFITLGQAWLLCGDKKYADEIFDQINDFIESNPIGFGVNWTCTMDVAIRASNWALGLELIRECKEIGAERWAQAYQALWDHGHFIYGNLENNYEVTSNHFLSNLVGLYYLSKVFVGSEIARGWERFSKDAIEKEMTIQVLPDGMDFESSIPYHRLVTELFLGVACVANNSHDLMSETFNLKLVEMINFHLSILRPDGLMPQIGDADDGRLHIFSRTPNWNPQNGMHLLASGQAVFVSQDWAQYLKISDSWEYFWWGGDFGYVIFGSQDLPSVERLYPDAGLAVYRNKNNYLLITNSRVGTEGFGNHKHNDLLSFEFYSDGVPLIIDPGSYVYTSNVLLRNIFRSTNSHNTLVIDNVEQNEINPEWIFRTFEKAYPENTFFVNTGNEIRYRGKHKGYSRLDSPVIHIRDVIYNFNSQILEINDELIGGGTHNIEWNYNFGPDIDVSLEKNYVFLSSNKSSKDKRWRMQVPDELEIKVIKSNFSPSYGVIFPNFSLKIKANQNLAIRSRWSFKVMVLN